MYISFLYLSYHDHLLQGLQIQEKKEKSGSAMRLYCAVVLVLYIQLQLQLYLRLQLRLYLSINKSYRVITLSDFGGL